MKIKKYLSKFLVAAAFICAGTVYVATSQKEESSGEITFIQDKSIYEQMSEPAEGDKDGEVETKSCLDKDGGMEAEDTTEAEGGAEAEKTTEAESSAETESDTDISGVSDKESGAETESVTDISGVSDKESMAASDETLININIASKTALMTLKGVGEKIAERIIEYRTLYGGFDSPEEIMKVKGIKEKTYEKIKDSICVE